MIYFDNAATTFPKPASVKDAVDTALMRYGANPGRSGHDLSAETAKQVFEVRSKAAEFFGAADVEDVVFTQNCTYAVNTVVKGLFKPGDHVIIPTSSTTRSCGRSTRSRCRGSSPTRSRRPFRTTRRR